eukprot:TRINITY_DN249_c0_g1_i1.p1 TRINITY_DN249_c0_g1~~TRINITY_DN249_c0_g1_i1.p1  ORF type:complete len:104 (+),score=23.63 TRINITY_DN249_c0_g1_i1:271-582(+)
MHSSLYFSDIPVGSPIFSHLGISGNQRRKAEAKRDAPIFGSNRTKRRPSANQSFPVRRTKERPDPLNSINAAPSLEEEEEKVIMSSIEEQPELLKGRRRIQIK